MPAKPPRTDCCSSPMGIPGLLEACPVFWDTMFDLKIVSLEQAVRKITSLPAQRQGLNNRGLLKEGFFADITIFDPATINDKATYTEPAQLSQGVKFVFVNGQLEFADGQLTGAKAGRPLMGPGVAGEKHSE